MCSQQLAGLGVKYGFHDALSFTQRDSLAITDVWEPSHFQLAASRLRLFFGEAHRGNLRMGIGTPRDVPGIEGMSWLKASDPFHYDDTFVHRLVRKPGSAGQVADGVQ